MSPADDAALSAVSGPARLSRRGRRARECDDRRRDGQTSSGDAGGGGREHPHAPAVARVWLETFPRTAFWTEARARFAPPVAERCLPASLVERFTVTPGDDVEPCLRFLAPITTRGGCAMAP